ncbi:MAG: beta-ketoacyl synthase N-terminal-like domain-containing protein [Candidatus Binatia bacterium]
MSDAVITGLGVVSPLGHAAPEVARRVAAGECAVGDADGVRIADLPLDVVPAAARTRIGRLDRVCRLGLAATFLALDDAALTLPLAAPERAGLVFGTGLGCLLSDAEFFEKVVAHGAPAASPRVFAYTVSSAAAGEVSIALGLHGPNTTLHMGMAAGAGALGYAVDLIDTGRADVVLAGGVDAHDAALATALRDMRLLKTAAQARPFVDAIAGVWPAEGAAVVVLERAALAAARGARVHARVAGHGAGFEPTLTSRTPAADGIAATLTRARRGQQPPQLVLASAQGTPLDAVERAALATAGLDGVRVLAPKAQLGEAFGASSALATAMAPFLGAERVLVSAVCPGGSVGAVLVERAG